jgi:hypothetical protein
MFHISLYDKGVLLPGLEHQRSVRESNEDYELVKLLTLRAESKFPIIAEVGQVYPLRVPNLSFSSSIMFEVIAVKILCSNPFMVYGIPVSYFEVES